MEKGRKGTSVHQEEGGGRGVSSVRAQKGESERGGGRRRADCGEEDLGVIHIKFHRRYIASGGEEKKKKKGGKGEGLKYISDQRIEKKTDVAPITFTH